MPATPARRPPYTPQSSPRPQPSRTALDRQRRSQHFARRRRDLLEDTAAALLLTLLTITLTAGLGVILLLELPRRARAHHLPPPRPPPSPTAQPPARAESGDARCPTKRRQRVRSRQLSSSIASAFVVDCAILLTYPNRPVWRLGASALVLTRRMSRDPVCDDPMTRIRTGCQRYGRSVDPREHRASILPLARDRSATLAIASTGSSCDAHQPTMVERERSRRASAGAKRSTECGGGP